MVILDLDRPAGTGYAATSTGDRLTAEPRLACQANTPGRLGGKGEVLDLGRTTRLFTPAQRKALELRHQQCTTEGCDIPATWCEAHHQEPVEPRRRPPHLAHGKAPLPVPPPPRPHDPAWDAHHAGPNGSTTFTADVKCGDHTQPSPPPANLSRP